MAKYRVRKGMVHRGIDDDGFPVEYTEGDVVELTDQQAVSFADKFVGPISEPSEDPAETSIVPDLSTDDSAVSGGGEGETPDPEEIAPEPAAEEPGEGDPVADPEILAVLEGTVAEIRSYVRDCDRPSFLRELAEVEATRGAGRSTVDRAIARRLRRLEDDSGGGD